MRCCAVLVTVLFTSSLLAADCVPAQDHRTDKSRGLVVESVHLAGTRNIDSSEMSSIIGALTGSCFDENDDMATYIRDEFQQRGYMLAKVEHVRIQPGDALVMPRPATIKADVSEGPLYHVGEFRFEGNSAFTAEELAAAFPLKPGAVFSSTRVRSGFGALRTLYGAAGYIEVTFVPDVEMQSAQSDAPKALIRVTLNEGKQYHMGKLQVFGPKDQSGPLLTRWALQEGAPFDAAYPQKFLQENRAILPQDFQERQGLHVSRNCRDATVTVAVILDWRDAVAQNLSDTDCEKPKVPQR